MHRFICPHCQAALKLRSEQPPAGARCPRCQKPLAAAVAVKPIPEIRPIPELKPIPARSGSGVLMALLILLGVGAVGAGGWFIWQRVNQPGTQPQQQANNQTPPEQTANNANNTNNTNNTSTNTDNNPPTRVVNTRGTNNNLPEENSPRSDRPIGKRYALLVGVQEYGSEDLPDLRFTDADIEEFADVLLKADYPAEQVVVLTQARGQKEASLQPTAPRIRAALDDLLKKCQRDDLLLVAFAGHGIEVQETGRFYFCPVGAKLKETDSLVSLNEVYDRLKNCAAGYKLLLADACRNDPASRGIPEERNIQSVTRRMQTLAPPGGVMAFYSCSPGQYAYEPDELKHGVFFHYLIEGLRGDADLDGDSVIIREEVEAYVKKRVRAYASQKLRREQWPHLMGDSNDQRPLVVLAGTADGGNQPVVPVKPKTPRKPLPRSVLLEEDFQNVEDGELPRGWDDRKAGGRGVYGVQKDASGRKALETLAKSGNPPIILPTLNLRDDFYVECEFLIGDYQTLSLHLSGLSLGAGLETTVDSWGSVTLADVPAKVSPRFTRLDVNRLRLTREGDIYRVSINESVVLAAPLPYKGWFDTIELHLTAGASNANNARIYSVRAGLLEPGEEKGKPQASVLLAEDFTRVPEGKRPDGWDDRKLYKVVTGPSGRRILQAMASQHSYPITLPRLAIQGDFFVESEFMLGDYMTFWLRLEGSGPGAATLVHVDAWGNVGLGVDGEPKPSHFRRLDVNRIRLEREKDRYIVRVNDIVAVEAELPYTGSFDSVQLFVSGGGSVSNAPETGVFAVKAAVVGPPREAEKPRGTTVLYEDFVKLEAGELPEGWPDRGLFEMGRDPAGAVGICTSAEKDLQICRVPLPRPLEGDFFAECEFALGDYQNLQIIVEGKDVKIPVDVTAWGVVTLATRAGVDGQKAFYRLKPNRLRLERTADRYTVRLNDAVVTAGILPFKGNIEKLSLALTAGDSNISKARIYAVRAGLFHGPK